MPLGSADAVPVLGAGDQPGCGKRLEGRDCLRSSGLHVALDAQARFRLEGLDFLRRQAFEPALRGQQQIFRGLERQQRLP
jgi:hypothetical protein